MRSSSSSSYNQSNPAHARAAAFNPVHAAYNPTTSRITVMSNSGPSSSQQGAAPSAPSAAGRRGA